MAELVYHGERSHVTDYVPRLGWRIATRRVEDMYCDNGFDPPDDETAAAFADVRYLTAKLT